MPRTIFCVSLNRRSSLPHSFDDDVLCSFHALLSMKHCFELREWVDLMASVYSSHRNCGLIIALRRFRWFAYRYTYTPGAIILWTTVVTRRFPSCENRLAPRDRQMVGMFLSVDYTGCDCWLLSLSGELQACGVVRGDVSSIRECSDSCKDSTILSCSFLSAASLALSYFNSCF